MYIIIFLLVCALCNADQLPQRKDITTGTLANGLHYVLKSHSSPKNQISLRMHIATGSINETDDELGLAHFLEHMAFAGSVHFPKGSEDERFRDLGFLFGAHLNAETSFTYTNYRLELPGNSETIASCGLLFLADVLDRLTLDEATIERERGTILEEKRLSDMTPGNKMEEAWSQQLLAGSFFAKRMPIGTEEKILSVTRKDFLRYYNAYYRTDISTIIMVGDMDTDLMLKLVEEHFGPIEPRAKVEGNDRTIPPTTDITVYIEQGVTIKRPEVAMGRILPLEPTPRTVEEAEKKIIGRLAQMAMQSRIDMDAKISQETSHNLFNGIGLAAKDDTMPWEEMLETTIDFLSQAKSYGFTAKELEKVKRAYVKELEYQAKLKQDSKWLANEFLMIVMEGKVFTDHAEIAALCKPLIEKITLDQINNWWKAFELTSYFLKLSLPESHQVPSKRRLLSVAKRALKKRASKYKPSKASEVKNPMQSRGLKAAAIVERTKYDESDVTTMLLENGVKVHIRRMEVPSDEILMQVTLAGGKIEETPETYLLTDAVYKAYDFETSHLRGSDVDSIVESKDMGVHLTLADDHLRFDMNANREGIETAFQLLHALIQDPKLSSKKFKKWKEKKTKSLDHRLYTLEERAEQVFAECAFDAREIRLKAPTDPLDISKIKFHDCKAWIKCIFHQAPIGVSVVGNINPSKIVKLARRYFGTLPARPVLSESTFADRRMLALNPGPYEKSVVHPCETNAAFVVGGYITSEAKGAAMNLADTIILQRLLQKARMDERLIYSIDLDYDSDGYDNGGYCLIKASCSPENQKRLSEVMDEVLITLRDEGPTEKELACVKKNVEQSIAECPDETILPYIWLTHLSDAFWRKDPEQQRENIIKTGKLPDAPNFDHITPDDIKTLLHGIIKPENRVQIVVQGSNDYK